jgi:hypothetical protein
MSVILRIAPTWVNGRFRRMLRMRCRACVRLLSALRERYYHRRGVEDSDEAVIAPDAMDAGIAAPPTQQIILPAVVQAVTSRGPAPGHLTFVENQKLISFDTLSAPGSTGWPRSPHRACIGSIPVR